VDPRWALTLAILAVVVLVQRLATLPDYWPNEVNTDHRQVLVARSGLVEAVLAAAAALTFAVLASRAIRRLPASLPAMAPTS
jgi:hypothetical protein